MSASPNTVPQPAARSPQAPCPAPDGFLQYLPVVRTHAQIWFRHLPAVDREECVAEAVASAFCTYTAACRRGRSHAVRPSTLADFAVKHVRSSRHVGGSQESKGDVLSRRAQKIRGFRVHSLPKSETYNFDILKVPDQDVWKRWLLHDRQTPVPDQAAFRIDWSSFMSKQQDRTRTALAMLAAGHKQIEVADRLSISPPAVCQRLSRAEREWRVFQGESPGDGAADAGKPDSDTDRANHKTARPPRPAA